MKIADIAIEKRTSVVILTLVLMIFGMVSYQSLPREASPDITVPYIFVNTPYPGVAPEDIEKSISIPIEKKLKGLEAVKKIQSSSTEGISSIVIEFVAGTDIDDVLSKTKDKVDLAKPELPTDLEDDPEVFEINVSEMPMTILSLSGPAGLVRLKDIAEDLEEDIESIPGVLEATITGGLEREIRVEPFPAKLAYYNLSIVDLQTVISKENQNVSGGAIRMGDGRFQLRVPGEFKSPGEIYGLVVGLHDGRPVYLKDVARVVDGFKDEEGRSRMNGQPAVNIQVKKRAGENVLRIDGEIDQLVEAQKPFWPKGTTLTKVLDRAKEIKIMISDLENNIITGLILVVITLFFVLGTRNAVLVALAIPFSMLMTFSILQILGITLNMVVLFALTLALGMLVDNAIVIVENIFRYMEQGVPRIEAAMRGTGEVSKPVIASTLTTVLAFFPMIYWPGTLGEFMAFLPKTVIITLLASLFVALIITPALAAIFMRLPAGHAHDSTPRSAEDIREAGESPIAIRGPVLKTYRAFLTSALNHRVAVLGISFMVLIALLLTWIYTVGLEKSMEFFPSADPKGVYVNFDMPEGADLDYADRIAGQVENAVCFSGHDPEKQGISDIKNIKYVYSNTVAIAGGGTMDFEERSPNHIGIQFYDLKDRNEPSPKSIETIRERLADLSGAEINITKQEEGMPTGLPINIEVSGNYFEVLGRISKDIQDVLEKMPDVQDIRDDHVAGSPTVRVEIDRQRASLMGLSTEVVGFALKVAFNGIKVSTYREGDEDYDITVQLPITDRKVTDVLRELLIPTPKGLVPLSTIARFKVVGGLGQINRINHERVVTVKADVKEANVPGSVVRAQAEEGLKHLPMPPGYKAVFTGEFEFQQEAEDFLVKAFGAALFLIFLVLVTQFNSVSQPFIIMTSVLLSLGGVFLGLAIMDLPFGIVMTGVGVISLAGVVVNNAIVLIDYINRLKERGMNVKEAIIAAGCTRLRPVLLTAITTILGLTPMVTGISFDFHNMELVTVSESSQLWKGMASAVIYGLTLATILTLVVVPTLYSLIDSLGKNLHQASMALYKGWWAPYYRWTGTTPEEKVP